MSTAREAGVHPHEAPFGFWLANYILTPERRRYSFRGRPFMVEIAAAAVSAPELVIEKASQLGVSLLFLLSAIYMLLRGELPAGSAYWFPNDGDVADFSSTKCGPLVRLNYFADQVRGKNEVTLKQFGDAFLYFRGLQTTMKAKSIPVDLSNWDEAQEIPEDAVKLSEERMGASDLKWKRYYSIPNAPGTGIDRRFQQTDRRYWTIRCTGCRRDVVLEQSFPDCLLERRDRTVVRCCPKCKKQIDVESGRWVAQAPEAPVRGYHLSQLFSPTIEPAEILQDFKTTKSLGVFHHGRLGNPWVDSTAKIDLGAMLALAEGGPPRAASSTAPTYCGVDVGNGLHWVAIQMGVRPVLHMGVEEEFPDLHRRLTELSASRVVIDARPETRMARDLSNRREWKGKMHLAFYEERAGAAEFTQDKQRNYFKVSINRTEGLDELLARFRDATVQLPREDPVVREFCEHVAALMAVEVLTPRKEIVKRYESNGPDHFAHAALYAFTALGSRRAPIRSYAFGGV